MAILKYLLVAIGGVVDVLVVGDGGDIAGVLLLVQVLVVVVVGFLVDKL